MAGCNLWLLSELDTLGVIICGWADAQGNVISAEVGDAWDGPVVGQSSEHVLGAGNVYHS